MSDDSSGDKDGFLASAEEITQLLAVVRPEPPTGITHAPKPEAGSPNGPENSASSQLKPSPGGRQRCQCGNCPYCLDNARWERIFNEKFADPTYYRRLALRYNSTLAEPR